MGAQANIQIRTLDPYGRLDSDILNRFSRVIVPGGRGIIQGLDVIKKNDHKVTVGLGLVVKENVIIEYTADLDLTVDTTDDGYQFVVMTYNFYKSDPPPEALIQLKLPADLTLESDLIVKIVYINNHVVEALYNVYPIDPDLYREDESYITAAIAEHNVATDSHPDIRSLIAQIVSGAMEIEIEAGESLLEHDPVCLIDNKAYKATNDFAGNPDKIGLVGLAKADIFVGQLGIIRIGGDHTNPAWSFTSTSTHLTYLDGNTVVDVPPTTGAVIKVGTKQDSNTILISPQILFLRS